MFNTSGFIPHGKGNDLATINAKMPDLNLALDNVLKAIEEEFAK